MQIGDQAAELGPTRQQLSQVDLAAEAGRGLVQGDVVAALGGDGGGFHTARPATDDGDAARGLTRCTGAEFELAAGLGVLDARDRESFQHMADTGLIAGDTGANIVEAAGRRLRRHIGIADHRPGHADHIGLAGGQDLFGGLRLVDPPGDEHRQAGIGFDRGRERRDVSVVDRHRRHDMNRAGEPGGGPGGDVDVVDHTVIGDGGGERGGDLDHLVGREPVMVHLVAGNSHADDHVGADRGTDRRQDFAHERQAARQVAAVAVLAAVDARIEELRQKVALAGDHFDTVEAGPAQPRRGIAKAGDDLLDHRGRQRARHDVEALVGHRRRRVGHRMGAVGRLAHLAAGMVELAENLAVMLVASLGDAAVAFDAVVAIGEDRRAAADTRGVCPRRLDDDQPGTAGRARGVIGDHARARVAVVQQHGHVAGGENSVLEAMTANGQRREQMGKLGRHVGAPYPGSRLASCSSISSIIRSPSIGP